MKSIILSLILLTSSIVIAQTEQTIQSAESQEQIKCEEAQKDEKNKNFSVGGKVDGSSHFCIFNRWFGSSYCEGFGGTFKKGFLKAGTCTIGTS